MDLGTKIVVLVASLVGLVTAVVAYRTARLKHEKEATGTAGNVKRQPGPFDDMLEILGSFGAVLGPMLAIYVVYFLIAGGIKVLSTGPSPSPDPSEQSSPSQAFDRNSLTPKQTKLLDMTEAAASMSKGISRDDALRHVVKLALAEKGYPFALLAASKMARGISRDEALDLVAISA